MRYHRYNATAEATLGQSPLPDTGAAVQLGNALGVGVGLLAFALWLAPDAMTAARLGLAAGGLTLAAQCSADVIGEWVVRFETWFRMMPAAPPVLKSKPLPPVIDVAPSFEPESLDVRMARNEMIALLRDSLTVADPDPTRIPSDDRLGKAWSGLRRARVVKLFGDALVVKKSGGVRGTFTADGCSVAALLAEVRAKTLTPPLLAGDVSVSG